VLPLFFVLVPLLIYLPLFLYESWCSIARLHNVKRGKTGYVDATWEITHTFLIIGVVNFIWLYSAAMIDIAHAVYWGLLTAGAWFIVRGTLYIYLFYGKNANQQSHVSILDWLFAISHLAIVAGLLYTIIQAAKVLLTNSYPVNIQFIPFMWPGLLLLIVLGTIPLLKLYRTKS
jgi:ABC-type sulfate transport system permease subunit